MTARTSTAPKVRPNQAQGAALGSARRKQQALKGRPNKTPPEYDLTNAVQGKYFSRFQSMRLRASIDPDVARSFPDSRSINDALRKLAATKKVRRRKAG